MSKIKSALYEPSGHAKRSPFHKIPKTQHGQNSSRQTKRQSARTALSIFFFAFAVFWAICAGMGIYGDIVHGPGHRAQLRELAAGSAKAAGAVIGFERHHPVVEYSFEGKTYDHAVQSVFVKTARESLVSKKQPTVLLATNNPNTAIVLGWERMPQESNKGFVVIALVFSALAFCIGLFVHRAWRAPKMGMIR